MMTITLTLIHSFIHSMHTLGPAWATHIRQTCPVLSHILQSGGLNHPPQLPPQSEAGHSSANLKDGRKDSRGQETSMARRYLRNFFLALSQPPRVGGSLLLPPLTWMLVSAATPDSSPQMGKPSRLAGENENYYSISNNKKIIFFPREK